MPKASIQINHQEISSISKTVIGATHAQYDADDWNDPGAVASARKLMQSSLTYQNQHIMGWGADNPEPSPGVYNWDSLDERVQMMRDTHAKMVLTLCGAPGWMHPSGYQNDWDNLEIAPAPDHVQDFANLAKQVALRYPDVKYFQVWNELKGMWSTSPGATPGLSRTNRWDYERYTTLYNAVYDTIKHVRPDAQLGGPYVVMDSYGNKASMSNPGPSYNWGTLDQRPLDVIKYWLQHKHGADFILVDGTSSNRDNVWQTNEFATAQKFSDVYNQIRQMGYGGTALPIWWAEWYAGVPDKAPKSLAYYNALMTSAAIHTIQSGASVMLFWQPQGDNSGYSFPEGLWSDTTSANGGQPTPFYTSAQTFFKYFGPGTYLMQTSSSSTDVSILASTGKMVLVNHLSKIQNVSVNGTSYSLQPYQVLLTNTP